MFSPEDHTRMARHPSGNLPPSRGAPTHSPAFGGLGVDVPELQQARALWQHNRFDESVALFEKAARKYPQNLLALTDASRALGARFEIAKAEVLLDRLMALGQRNAQVLHLAGQSYRMIFRPEKAIDCFQRALSLRRDIPDAHLELAVLYERRHRLAEAENCVEECLRCAPEYWEAKLMMARLLRRRKDESAAERMLRGLCTHQQVHPFVRAQAWAEIAQLLDHQSEFDPAMEAMLQCKAILREYEAPIRNESEMILGILREIAESMTLADLQRWTEAGRAFPARKVALLTSFPRSGTTLLEQLLDAHPRLVSSDEREAFARDIFPAMWMGPGTPKPTLSALNGIPAEHIQKQRERYLAYMEAALNEPIGERMHLDKNPAFTLLLPAVLRLFPEMKLLIALRDPRDVVLSCFMQYLPLNTNSICYLSLERTAERYTVDLGVWRRLREWLPASRWLEVRYEDTVANIERESRRSLEFLGLPWDAQVLDYRERLKTKPVASPTYEAVARPLYTSSIGRWRNYERHFATSLRQLEPFAKAFGYD